MVEGPFFGEILIEKGISFNTYVYIAICFLFAMYIAIFWIYQIQHPNRLLRNKKIIFGVTLIITSSIIYFFTTIPSPVIYEEEAINLAEKELEKHFPKAEIHRSDLPPDIWLRSDINGGDLIYYDVGFGVGYDRGLAGFHLIVNGKTGEVYDSDNRNLIIVGVVPIKGRYEHFIFRLRNITLKIKIRANLLKERFT
ncbi:MAG: hypothetical protein ACYC2T_02085 [Bacillota bacterium]